MKEFKTGPFLMNKKYSEIGVKTKSRTLDEFGIENITGFNEQLIYCAAEGCPRVSECAAIGEYICRTAK